MSLGVFLYRMGVYHDRSFFFLFSEKKVGQTFQRKKVFITVETEKSLKPRKKQMCLWLHFGKKFFSLLRTLQVFYLKRGKYIFLLHALKNSGETSNCLVVNLKICVLRTQKISEASIRSQTHANAFTGKRFTQFSPNIRISSFENISSSFCFSKAIRLTARTKKWQKNKRDSPFSSLTADIKSPDNRGTLFFFFGRKTSMIFF